MKMVKGLIIGSSMLLCTDVNGMESLSWITGKLVEAGQAVSSAASAAGQAASAVGQSGMALFRNDGVGDFLDTSIPEDIKRILLAISLCGSDFKERVQRIVQLRTVSKKWNSLLRDEKYLRALLPAFAYKGLIPILTKQSMAPEDGISLACLLNDRIIATPEALQPICRCLDEVCLQSDAAQAPSQIVKRKPYDFPWDGKKRKVYLLNGVGDIDVELITSRLAKAWKCAFKPTGQTLQLNAFTEKLVPFACKFLNEIKGTVVLADREASAHPDVFLIRMGAHNWPFSLLRPISDLSHLGELGQQSCLLEDILAMGSEDICVLTARGWQLTQKFVAQCHVIEFTKPSLAERRIILELYVDELRRFCDQAAREQMLANVISSIEISNPEHQRMIPNMPVGLKGTIAMGALKVALKAALAFENQEWIHSRIRRFAIETDVFSPDRLDAIAARLDGLSCENIQLLFQNIVATAQAYKGDAEVPIITSQIIDVCIKGLLSERNL